MFAVMSVGYLFSNVILVVASSAYKVSCAEGEIFIFAICRLTTAAPGIDPCGSPSKTFSLITNGMIYLAMKLEEGMQDIDKSIRQFVVNRF